MKHSNINIDRPALTQEEIQRGQNFTKLLKIHQGSFSKPWYAKPLNYVLVGSIVALALGAWFYFQPNSTIESMDNQVVAFAEERSQEDLLNPPLPATDTPFSTYTVNANNGGVINHLNSEINIPPSIFEDKNGNLVTGDVQIEYREFHDKIDVMLSGIPMGYDSAGTRYHFETGGMLEVRGYQNGEALSIVSGKSLSVAMSTSEETDSEGAFNFYYLNEETSSWEFLSEADRENVFPRDLKRSYIRQEEYWIIQNNAIESIYAEISNVQTEISEIKSSKPIPPKKADVEAYQIELSFNEKDFPELNAYSGTKFEVDESTKAFDPGKAAKDWNDVKIKEGKSTGKYQVTFYRPGESYEVTCIPVLGEADMAAAQTVYEQKFNQYKQDLKTAEALAESLEQERQARIAEQRARIADAQAQRKRWEAARQEVAAAENSMTNFFTINAFGFYNCDAPRQLPKGRQYSNPRFFDTNGDVLVHGNIYLLIEGQNRVINYFDGHQIQFDPDQKNTLVTITEDKKLAVLEDPELDALEEKDECPIKMYVYPNKINTANDVRNVLKSTSIDL